MPRQVVVLGSICVRPLSVIRAKGSRSSLDLLSNLRISSRESTLTATLHCPSPSHASHHSANFLRASSAAETAA